MSKSNILIDKLAKLIEQGMINSKDFSEEIRNILRFKLEEIARKLNFVTKEEFEVQKERITRIEKKLNSIVKRKKKLKR
tara:strand:- start:134 stop:370 length:237 start_codon:yes stop_codon:yes gene_type:complete